MRLGLTLNNATRGDAAGGVSDVFTAANDYLLDPNTRPVPTCVQTQLTRAVWRCPRKTVRPVSAGDQAFLGVRCHGLGRAWQCGERRDVDARTRNCLNRLDIQLTRRAHRSAVAASVMRRPGRRVKPPPPDTRQPNVLSALRTWRRQSSGTRPAFIR